MTLIEMQGYLVFGLLVSLFESRERISKNRGSSF